jgi:biopolymer transport protein ExbD
MIRKARPHEREAELNIVPYLDIIVNLVMFMLMSMTGFERHVCRGSRVRGGRHR